MPTFETREPVFAVIDVAGVELTVHAGSDGRTTVDVQPHNPARGADVELAERTSVDLTAGRLVVRSPRTARSRVRTLFGGGERIDVAVSLPAGSTLEVRGWANVTAVGPLAAVDIDTAMGDISLDRVGRINAKTSMGDIRVGSATERAQLRTAAGSIEVGRAAGELTADTATGDVRVQEGAGELRLATTTGDIRVEKAAGPVRARTGAGDVRLRSVRTGAVTAHTSYGQLEIGVAQGTAAWLDVEARHGVVRSELEQAEGPSDGEHTVEIRATTGYGDILLRRA